ncbi:MAG: MarR family transcriptional regulator [Bacteroidota bacterium]
MVATESRTTNLDQLEQHLFTLSDIYRKHQEYIKAKHKITGLEMEIIQLVIMEGPQKMKDIGKRFNVKLSTLTSIIDKIEKQRLVKRVNSKEDRRVVFLEVSKKGEKLFDSYRRYLNVIAQMMCRHLGQEHIQALSKGMELMSSYVTSQES